MTSSPTSKPVEGAATSPQVRREGAKPVRDRDWPLILGILGFVLTLFSIVVMGFFHLEGRIDGLETSLAARIDALAARMDGLETSLGARMDALAARMDGLETSLGARIDGLYEFLLSLKR